MVQVCVNSCKNGEKPRGHVSVHVEKRSGIYTLNEAIEEAKIGKYQIIITILTGISVLGSVIENTNASFILPYAKCDLKLTTAEQGILSAVSYLGIVMTSHMWGFLADTWGRKKVIRLAAMGGFIFAFMSAFAVDTISMTILRFLAGALVSGAASTGYSYISEFHTSETAARSAAYVSVAMSSLWVVIPPVAMIIIPMDWSFFIYTLEFKPWRLFLLCSSLVNLFSAVVFSILPETPKFSLIMNRKEEALETLSRIYAINTGLPKEKYPVKDIEMTTMGNSLSESKRICGFFKLVVKQTKPIFQAPLLTNTWKLCYIYFVLFCIGHGVLMWFPDFLAQLYNYDGVPKTLCEIVGPKKIGNSTEEICFINNKDIFPFQLIFFAGVCFLSLAILSSFYFDKLEPKKLIGGWLLTSIITCVLLNFLTEFYGIVISFVIFLSCCTCGTILTAIAVNLFPTNYRAMATAFIMMCGRIGGVSGSTMIGFLLEDSCTTMFYSFGALLLSCIIVFIMIEIKPH